MRLLLLATLLLAARAVCAETPVPPEDGIWGDPSQSGSGFVIETHNRTMAVAAFAYDAQRRASWYLGTGPYDYTNRRWSGRVSAFTGGQCLGCTHSSPTPIEDGANLEIRFSSPTTGAVFIDGVQKYAIRRSYFDSSNIDDFVLGEWYFAYPTAPAAGTLAGDDLLILQEASCASGPCTTGARFGDLRPVTGTRGSANTYQFLLDSSTQFWTLYLVIPYKNTMRGSVFVFPKGTEPSQAQEMPGVWAVRLATRAALTAGGVQKSALAQADAKANAFYSEIYERQRAAKGEGPATTLMSDAELDAAAKALGAY